GAGEPALPGATGHRGHPADQPPRTAGGKSRDFRLRALAGRGGRDRATRAPRRAHRRLRLFGVAAMGLTCNGPRRLARLAILALLAGGAPISHLALTKAACAEPARSAVRSSAAARDKITLPRARPATVGTEDGENGYEAQRSQRTHGFREPPSGADGTAIPGASIPYLHPPD